jgi:Ca-activated chloride channel family protein
VLLFFAWIGGAWAQGFLIPTDRRLPALGLKHHRVQVKIRDRAARTKVTQVFVNSTNRLLEATYIFPLPKGATISNFVLYINGKRTTGKVLVRQRATAIYQSIVRRMRDPGLLEHIGGRLFKARVFPIPRRGEQKIEIAFTQVVPYRSGIHRFVYPLKTNKQTLRTIQDLTMSVDLRSKTALKNIYSPTHKISTARRGDKRAIVGFEKNQAHLNRDFVMYYSVSPKALGLNMLTHRVKGKDGYFLMMATPKVSYGSKELMGKNVTFVLDTSGSMATNKRMKWAKRALASCIKKLNPKDHFNIIRFSTDVEGLFSAGLQQANGGNIQRALKFVKRLEAAGGTAIDEAMQKALRQAPKGKGVNIVVMITDGHPTIGETDPSTILKNVKKANKHKARIFTFGIGNSINIKLLDKMAQETGGTGDYVKPGKDIEQRISWFYDKVRYPVLSDIQLAVSGGIRIVDTYPKRLPDLFRGGQILLFGRYRGKGHGAITLRGTVNGSAKRYVFESSFPNTNKDSDFIPRLWAHRKIAYLLDNIRLHGERGELKNEVIRLAKKFGIVTPYTSYLVLEDKDRWRFNSQTKTPNRPIIQGRTRWRRWRRGRRLGGADDSIGVTGRGFGNVPSKRRARRKASAAPVARSAPRPPAPPTAGFSTRSMQESSGKGARNVAKTLSKLKKKQVMGASGHTRSRYIKGRLFLYQAGQWVDQTAKKAKKTIKVKYLSSMYFKILSMRPDLKPFLALGQRVTIAVSKRHAIVIGASETTQSNSQLKAFLKK